MIHKKVMNLAHAIKVWFTDFGKALTAAWRLIKLQMGIPVQLKFAKAGGEVREANAVAISTLSTIDKGFIRFVEMLDTGRTQWRSLRLERMIF